MKTLIFSLYILLLFNGCQKEKEELPKEFISLLDKIIKDEYPFAGLIIDKTSPIIEIHSDNQNDSVPPPSPIFSYFPFEDFKEEIEPIDELKILYSKNLEIKKLSNTYHLKLNNPKIKLVSLEEIKKLKTKNSDIESFNEKLDKKYGNHHLLVVSTPIFTKKKDLFIFGINYVCGGLCGEGSTFTCRKINNEWIIEKHGKWES